ncbi:hypothetical protein FT663_04481 [Candidozyma haemuli var. vulneris]|uniref:Ribosome-recycling factor, mitochondrial n=1 Tax=Candidozyma haemuli TaxID=45357 RepID=A0A2V1ASY2_9ASCO|nr:hypothetical protein CXQ85_001830 [[Candida] haemuloni]KAF3987386.1 hypothetical protein FT663_04481 [[Candida] haemuloni var. vulneris]KAF3993150.1 hypothetical protein FT662_00778 [[Candida] haemuloni var. vulneris]PVH20051.1 hypothetical protein CXQ85_001830 [[Candida] haemuloni]
MFRSILRPSHFARARLIPIVPAQRNFHATPLNLKKRLSKKTVEVEENEAAVGAPEVNFDELKTKMQAVIDRFGKVANEAKVGRTSPSIFDDLTIKTTDGDLPFTATAQTAVKGRNFQITVFDPSNTKNIVSAILASGLNMTPISDPQNKQQLKVPLPPVTTDSKKETVKQLKESFERHRNGPGGHSKNAHTLASIRGDLKRRLSKKQKKSDDETKAWNDFEKLHKQYCDKLQDVFKAAEKAILK